jgi:thiol-disulfide isomerase/thioredoxin
VSLWLYVMTSLALIGNEAERTYLHFSSHNCGACRVLQPLVDELKTEGWAIRSIDTEQDRTTRDRWHVKAIPTLIVIENGIEVDRIEGTLPRNDLRKRLAGNTSVQVATKEPGKPQNDPPVSNRSSIYGPNHPLNKNRSSSKKAPSNNGSSAILDSQRPMIGPNHPLYEFYYPPQIALRESVPRPSRKGGPNPLLKDVIALPSLSKNMEATVRIKVQYLMNESVGTGTIIEVIGDQVVVLTCGHLFREKESRHPVTVELFQNGKVVKVPASVIDFRNDKVDLGLVRFRQPNPVTKIQIRPRTESLRELEPVFSIGCDRGASPTRKDSLISKLNRYQGPSNVEVAGAPVQGRSGGGLFDAKGQLVGVCFASDEELDEGLFVGPESIYKQLEKFKLNYLFDRSPFPFKD